MGVLHGCFAWVLGAGAHTCARCCHRHTPGLAVPGVSACRVKNETLKRLRADLFVDEHCYTQSPETSADMEARVAGRHVLRTKDDTFFLTCHGQMNRDEAIVVHAEIEGILRRIGHAFIVVDVRDGDGATPECRRWIGEWNERHRATGVAIYGNTGTAARSIIAMVFAIIRFCRKSSLPMMWVKNEAEAMAWVAAERNKLVGLSP